MSNYSPSSPKFKQYVEQGNIALVREGLQAILSSNAYPDGEIHDALKWTLEHVEKPLFMEHNPEVEPFMQDKSKWDTAYYCLQKATLWDDFSRERFEHLIEIRDYLRAQGNTSFRHIQTTPPPATQSQEDGVSTENRAEKLRGKSNQCTSSCCSTSVPQPSKPSSIVGASSTSKKMAIPQPDHDSKKRFLTKRAIAVAVVVGGLATFALAIKFLVGHIRNGR